MLLASVGWLLGLTLIARGQDGGNGSDELASIAPLRAADLSQFPTPEDISSIPTWLSSQGSDGTWSDVNYQAGCGAQRANWPIQDHWIRLIAFASAWSGLNPDIPANWTGNAGLLRGVQRGLDWWLDNDYTSDDCISLGGNWFAQVILIPQLLSTTCLLVASELSSTELDGCVRIPYRAYQRKDDFINGLGYLTGANTINVMQDSVSMALYMNNATILSDALHRAMAVFSDSPAEDGIHRDGSFLQHGGILYNGNYGKDLLNAFIQLEGEVIGTAFAANDTTRQAFATHVRGGEWMIYVDTQTGQEHWDLNAVGRFIAFPTVDLQATADINFNVTKLAAATSDFTGADSLNDTVSRLGSNGTHKLDGNKMFYASDYMVHRRDSFILTNKMISTRSHNTEYTNSANPYGYHLGQGTLFSYVTGYEYRDIQAAWDWNLIPGTTVLLDHPTLESSFAGVTGNRTFVGGASDGWVDTSVGDYVDPHDTSLRYRKAWFFLDDSAVVTVSGLEADGAPSSSVVTVLDQRLVAPGGIYVDGTSVDASRGASVNGSTLFYGGNGYLAYNAPFQLTLSEANRTGDWSAISSSTVGNTTAPIFAAYTAHGSAFSYAVYPATDQGRLADEVANPTSTPIDMDGVSGVAGAERLSLVFWPDQKDTIASVQVDLSAIGWNDEGSITVSSNDPGVYLFSARLNDDGTRTLLVTLADPTQALDTTGFTLTTSAPEALDIQCESLDGEDGCEAVEGGVAFATVRLPQGGYAGDSVCRRVRMI